MANGTDVIDLGYESPDLPAIADDKLVSMAEQAEKRIEAVNKIKKLSLRVTNAHDWTDQGGKPYLQVSGSEKIARLFGISWRIGEPVKESLEGGHFSFTYKGEFTISGARIEAIGTRSSKDGFFKAYKWEGEGDNKQKVELPASEIDAGDVKKGAYTNCIGNGITRLLGIRNLTWEDLAETGITKENVGKVDYKRNGKQQETVMSEGAQNVVIKVKEVRKKEGEKNGKAWTAYTVVAEDGKQYKTFSESFAKLALDAKAAGNAVKIVYKESKFGNDIETLTKAEAPTDPEGCTKKASECNGFLNDGACEFTGSPCKYV
jgi:hypothetical protein